MNENTNVGTMKQFYTAFLAGDINQVLDLVTDDFVLSNDFTANVATAGEFLGKEGLERFFVLLGEVVSEIESFVPEEFIGDGDKVVVLGHERMQVRETEKWVSARWAQIGTFRDGKMCRWVEYSDTAAWHKACSVS